MIDPYSETILLDLETRAGARFTDLKGSVKNSRTLTKKLAALRSLELVDSSHGIYTLTGKGWEVARILRELAGVLGEAHRIEMERIPHPLYAAVLSRYVKILRDQFGQGLVGVLVFGSVARGDWSRDSDIDLLLILEEWEGPVWQRSRTLWPLKVRLMDTDEYRRAEAKGYTPIIQHYPLSRKEASEFHRTYLDASVEGIILYEKDEFLSKLLEGVREMLRDQGAHRVTIPGGGRYWVLSGDALL